MIPARIAVAGAGIYGATAALRLAERGHAVQLFDPLGILCAASAINQYRVHAGYHYPRSAETIAEIQEARAEFMVAFAPAIVRNSQHYYAIPREHSRTSPGHYEALMAEHGLALRPCRPEWMNFDFIERCYAVNEHIYDADVLRRLVEERIAAAGVHFTPARFTAAMRDEYDFVVWATYGLDSSRGLFKMAKFQIAEKILIELPPELRHVALVVVDGPFSAFDPYGSSESSLFGSALHTNHWSAPDARAPLPERYAQILNAPAFTPAPFTHFDQMCEDASRTAPGVKHAKYLGSRFTLRVVEDNPEHDRRILHVREGAPGELHIFSGKVVSAVKAARLVSEWVAHHG